MVRYRRDDPLRRVANFGTANSSSGARAHRADDRDDRRRCHCARLAFLVYVGDICGQGPYDDRQSGIYPEVWRSILKRPILGYGFGAFWYAGNFESQRIGLAVRWPNIGYAENGFLDLALQTGFLGVGLILMMIGKAAGQGIRLLRSPDYSPQIGWFLTILFLALLTNIDAGWFMTLNTLDWVLILIASIGLNEGKRVTQTT